MKSSFVIIVTLIGLYSVTGSDDWSYWGENGPAHWPGLCTTGKRQSPINLISKEAIKSDLGTLKFIRHDFAFSGKVTNNGHSVKVQLDGVPIHLEGADLPTTYILEQIHFHWPAEHTVDDNRDVLEIHFVHYSKQYPNTSIASQHKDGIAVVATLFELSNEHNLDIMPILKATELVSKGTGKSVVLSGSQLIPSLLLPKDRTTYYRYDGSLTTPGCQESVMWFILAQKLSISASQYDIFKNVRTDNGTLNFNYRPTQPLGDREVYLNLDGLNPRTTDHGKNVV